MPTICAAITLVFSIFAGQGLALRTPEEPEPRTVTKAELDRSDWCSFLTEKGWPAACPLEHPEHWLVQQHLQSNSTGVLELGGRYGTTTCEIAKKLGNSGRNIVVEPDHSVWAVLEQNLASHGCHAHIVRGIVGNANKRDLAGGDYGTRVLSLLQRDVVATPWREVERKFGVKIDTLLIDCEGCVDYFLAENPGLLDQVKLVLLEGDNGVYGPDSDPECASRGDCVDYNQVIKRLEEAGFRLVEEFPEEYAAFIHHFALKRV